MSAAAGRCLQCCVVLLCGPSVHDTAEKEMEECEETPAATTPNLSLSDKSYGFI